MTVRVRFAPSPTGQPHIGNIRTVVFNWLFARQHGGQFIIRVEDTDRTRYVPDAVNVIFNSLHWLGLDWDEGPDVGGPYGPYVQSERLPLYREKALELLDKGWAYRCNCPPERLERIREEQRARGDMIMYDGHCRDLPPDAISPDEPHVIRLKMPREGQTVVHDLLKGDVVFENSGIDDQVLLKSDGFPTYHLAVVVDDYLMQITHIIRGDDWLSSAPKHVTLYRAFGWELPEFAHVPLVLGADGKKLGKRHGAISVAEFEKQGYLPEALFNFLALVGWAPGEGEEQEIFTREELIQRFDLKRVNPAPAVFSYDKLDWMNGVYIRKLDQETLLERLIPFWQDAGMIPTPVTAEALAQLQVIVPLVQERLKTLKDVVPLTDFIFTDIPTPAPEKLLGPKMTAEQSLQTLEAVRTRLAALRDWDAATMEPLLRQLCQDLGLKAGQVFGLIRTATTGKEVAPPLFGCLEALGRQTTLLRLRRAEDVLEAAIRAQKG